MNIDPFLMQFKWDDTRFPRNQALSEILKAIQSRSQHVDNDLKGKVQNYHELKNQSQ